MVNRALPCLIAATAVAGFAAGCGAGSAPPASPSEVNARAEHVLVLLARCIQTHGLPSFPGPVTGDNGVPKFPDSAPRVPSSTRTACVSVANQLPTQYTETQPVSNSDLQKLMAFARCVRRLIPDWPDPNALGEFPINSRIEQGGKRLFVPAAHACARLNPDPSGGIHVVRARP
jgi:hypothetical protein